MTSPVYCNKEKFPAPEKMVSPEPPPQNDRHVTLRKSRRPASKSRSHSKIASNALNEHEPSISSQPEPVPQNDRHVTLRKSTQPASKTRSHSKIPSNASNEHKPSISSQPEPVPQNDRHVTLRKSRRPTSKSKSNIKVPSNTSNEHKPRNSSSLISPIIYLSREQSKNSSPLMPKQPQSSNLVMSSPTPMQTNRRGKVFTKRFPPSLSTLRMTPQKSMKK